MDLDHLVQFHVPDRARGHQPQGVMGAGATHLVTDRSRGQDHRTEEEGVTRAVRRQEMDRRPQEVQK